MSGEEVSHQACDEMSQPTNGKQSPDGEDKRKSPPVPRPFSAGELIVFFCFLSWFSFPRQNCDRTIIVESFSNLLIYSFQVSGFSLARSR